MPAFMTGQNFEAYLTDHKKKKGIVLTCRVHPGESNAQFIMEGMIEFLLSKDREAQQLRNQYVFKIVPMLNPDGVVYGNYRCSLLGVDLNRRWINPSKVLHPTIYHMKQLLKMFDVERKVELYTDVHGHSRSKNAFMYGCTVNALDPHSNKSNATIKALPYFIGQRNKLFRFNQCNFAVEREKEATARIVLFRELSLMQSFTLEVSFYGGEALSKGPSGCVGEEEEDEAEEEEEEEEEYAQETQTELSKRVRSDAEEERVIKLHCMKQPPSIDTARPG